MENKKEFKIAGMNYETWRAVCLKIGAQRMIKNGGDGVENCFKKCGFCEKEWRDFYEFLEDRDVFYRGLTEYEGLVVFFFDHKVCKTSMGVTAKQLGGFFQYMNSVYNKKPMS